jgi:hypothetical protein
MSHMKFEEVGELPLLAPVLRVTKFLERTFHSDFFGQRTPRICLKPPWLFIQHPLSISHRQTRPL